MYLLLNLVLSFRENKAIISEKDFGVLQNSNIFFISV